MLCKLCGIDEAGDKDLCPSCEEEWLSAREAINRLVSIGHTRHCACRQIWGDGECECGRMPFTTA